MNPRVTKLEVLAQLKLRLTFASGEVRIIDCSPYTDLGIFSALKEEEYFRQARLTNGTVSWPDGQDICPDTLYLDSSPDDSTRERA